MKRSNILSALIIVVILMASSLVLVGLQEETSAVETPTRDTGETLTIENETIVIDKSSDFSMKRWERIEFRDDAKLIIRGDQVITQEIVCREEFKNTSLIMENDNDLLAQLTVQRGVMNIKAEEISVRGATITVTNETELLQPGEKGNPSSMSLISRGSDLVISDTAISVYGQPGASSPEGGGSGGRVDFDLRALGGNDLDISGTDMFIQGGKGGDTFAPGWSAGSGGQLIANIDGRGITIRDTTISAKSGNAGAAGASSIGAIGGNCQMFIEAVTGDINIERTNLEAESGTSSREDSFVLSQIELDALSGEITWDEGKSGEDRFISLSTWKGDNLLTEAQDGAFFYQVDLGDSDSPQALSGTNLYIYWWAKVIVNDNTGTPMENVAIRYWDIQDATNRLPEDGPVFTDEYGEVWLQVAAFKDNAFPSFIFRAEDAGGAAGSSTNYKFDTNRNLNVYINLTTINIDITPPEGNIIGGDNVRFQGTAVSGGETNVVNRVVVYLEDEVLGDAEDISEDGAPPFSTWEYVWDSESVEDGFYTFNFIAFDNSYQATLTKVLEVNQTAVPHAPLLTSVIITDPEKQVEIGPGQSTEVNVNQNNNMIEFDVRVFDIDYRSDIINRGKELVSVDIRLIYVQTEEVIRTWVLDDFQSVNESGGFKFEFQVDSSKKPGTSEALDDGLYRVEMDIKDDADFWKRSQFFQFELFFDYYPNAYMFIDMLDGKRLESDLVPRVDQILDYEAFLFSTDKSHTVKVRFNLTRSTDQDSPRFGSGLSWEDLTITVRVHERGSGEGEKVIMDSKTVPTLEYEFNVEDVPVDETGNFDLWIEVTDSDGLQDTTRYIARIEHDPPEERHSILGDLTGVDALDLLESDLMVIINPVLLIIMIAAYAGLLFFLAARYNTDRKNKMEIIEKKRKQDLETRKDTSIEEEVSSKYMKTSQKYMESTGASKGKDEFAKELEAAKQKEEVKSGPVSQEQDKPQQPAPQQPPAQKPPAQQSPAPQQPPKPQTPPTQQPPAQRPPAQSPPAPQQQKAPGAPPAPPQPPKAPPIPPQPRE